MNKQVHVLFLGRLPVQFQHTDKSVPVLFDFHLFTLANYRFREGVFLYDLRRFSAFRCYLLGRAKRVFASLPRWLLLDNLSSLAKTPRRAESPDFPAILKHPLGKREAIIGIGLHDIFRRVVDRVPDIFKIVF